MIALIIMLSTSFSQLHATQYGLDYDHIFETVDTYVYTGGLHFLGIGHSFVKFPNTVQSVSYSEVGSSTPSFLFLVTTAEPHICRSTVRLGIAVDSLCLTQASHDRLHARTSDGLPLILGVRLPRNTTNLFHPANSV